jgi:hypothetical protein
MHSCSDCPDNKRHCTCLVHAQCRLREERTASVTVTQSNQNMVNEWACSYEGG